MKKPPHKFSSMEAAKALLSPKNCQELGFRFLGNEKLIDVFGDHKEERDFHKVPVSRVVVVNEG